jgi:hypothetical protein
MLAREENGYPVQCLAPSSRGWGQAHLTVGDQREVHCFCTSGQKKKHDRLSSIT